MKAIIRDDIIALDNFVAAEFKYKKYLEMIAKAGNYCFMDQIKKLIPNGDSIIKGMVEHNLVGTENLNNNYKYIYLSDTAMKYLLLRDSEEDYSDKPKNRISVKKVNKYPSEKQLLSSAYKFNLIVTGEVLVDKESIANVIRDIVYKEKIKADYNRYLEWLKSKKDNIEKINKEIEKLEIEKEVLEIQKNVLDKLTKSEEITFRFIRSAHIHIGDTLETLEKNKSMYTKLHERESGKIFSKDENFIKELNHLIIRNGSALNWVEILSQEINPLCNKLNNEKMEQYKIQEVKEKIQDTKVEIKNHIDEKMKIENHIETINKRIEEEINPRYELIKREFEKLYDISKVIARMKGESLEFLIFDTGNFKTAYGYLKQVNNLLKFKLEQKEIKIIIYSYSENRAKNLYNEFDNARKLKQRSLEVLKAYNEATDSAETKTDFYLAAEKRYDNTPDFNIEIRDDFYYMKKYKELTSSTSRSIKKKDKKAIESLIDKLNN